MLVVRIAVLCAAKNAMDITTPIAWTASLGDLVGDVISANMHLYVCCCLVLLCDHPFFVHFINVLLLQKPGFTTIADDNPAKLCQFCHKNSPGNLPFLSHSFSPRHHFYFLQRLYVTTKTTTY